MATPKPQIKSTFATPSCIHFLPVANEVNVDLRALAPSQQVVVKQGTALLGRLIAAFRTSY